jgi:hypothetical protein
LRLLLTLVIVGVLPLLIRAVRGKRISGILLVCYIIAVLVITLGSRSTDPESHVSLKPFTTYRLVIDSVRDGIRKYGWQELWKRIGCYKGPLNSIALSILLFVPFGYLVPSVFSFPRRWWRVLLTGLGFSLMIEVVQLITHLGWFDASDLFHNTVGAVVGYWVYWRRLRKATA